MSNQYSHRSGIVKIIILVVGVIFVLRLSVLQLFDREYKEKAKTQSLRNVTQYPARGLMYDRNGKMLVYNEAVYDLMVIPRMVKDLDTNFFCRSVGISRQEFLDRMEKAYTYSPYSASIFMKQISKEDFGRWENVLYRFKGFYISKRTLRIYDKPIAAHVLGYVGEVNEKDLEENPYYKRGDYIGKSGLEASYEEQLRGIKGKKIMQVDVHNREIGSYMHGEQDTMPSEGMNLYTTLDADLQEYAEKVMANKRGCIVAIEPSTGEVLTLLSAPTYDPNLLVGRIRGENFMKLNNDISKPLFNRALQAQYPPGSIFKVAQAMIALQLGVITPSTGFVCDKVIGCHNHPSARSVQEAIKMSCNPNVKKGNIPDTSFYNKWYGRGRWVFSTIYSNSIGQGEVEVVPLQMANLACIVANRGFFYTPHLVRYYGPDSTKNPEFYVKHDTGIERRYFDIAVRGMYDVVHGAGGTAHKADIPGIDVCGKTGTAENYGNDHSVFIAFAPKDDPKIAVAVYVENAQGGGGTWAAPIASLIIEKYIRGEVQRKDFEKYYIDVNPCQKLPLTRRIKKPKKR